MCLSWTLILSGKAGSIVLQSSGAPAGLLKKPTYSVYFYSVYLLSTLAGHLSEQSVYCGVVATLTGVSGIIAQTLSVSLVHSTTQAASTA